MKYLFLLLGIVAGWLVLQKYVFPRLGIST